MHQLKSRLAGSVDSATAETTAEELVGFGRIGEAIGLPGRSEADKPLALCFIFAGMELYGRGLKSILGPDFN